jgi:hypothetical protein
LQLGRGQLLLEQLGLRIVGFGVAQDPAADGMPTVVDPSLGLGEPQSLLLMALLLLSHGGTDGRPKLSDLREIPAQRLGLIAVSQRRTKLIGLEARLPALNQRPGEPTGQQLALTMPSDIVGPGDFKRLVEPAVSQRMFRLFDSQDQHRKVLWI